MNSIQTNAIERAIALLKAVGVPYAVQLDGVIHGTLRAHPVKPKAEPKRRSPIYDHLGKHDWKRKIDAAAIGAVLEFPVEDDDEGNSLRGSISSYATRNQNYGSGGLLTEFKYGTKKVSVLVVSRQTATA